MALLCYAAAAGISYPSRPPPPLRTISSIGRPAPSPAAGPWSTPRRRKPKCSVFCGTGVVAAAAAQAAQTLRHVCVGRVPDHILDRAEEIGFMVPTDMQRQSLPVLLSGWDCVLHAQVPGRLWPTLIAVPTRELGMQVRFLDEVTKVARLLAAEPA